MYAKKDNKVYTVDEQSKKTYLAQGFEICDDSGAVIDRPQNATVPYEDYAKLKAELDKLKDTNTKGNKDKKGEE